ncbi:protein PXR1-like [Zingiber officinale]|uniref:protein PXR1-like n=1 Tax=Zingiber officinale TaxID=94328 RepID=UPI001C4AF429|nr:protein PXR1-like [Zingiber officinale]
MANERSDSKESKNGVKKEAEGQSKVGKSKGKGLEIDMKKQIQRKPKEEAEKKKKEQVVVEKKKMTKRKMGDESLEMEKKKRRSTVGATENPEKKERKVKKGDMGEETAKKEKSRKKIENVSSIADDEEEAGNVSCSFPMSRVRRLMRLEGGNANVTITGIASNAVFLVNKASEMFLEKFVEDSYSRGTKRQKKSLNYNDLSSTVHGQKGYEFLSDFVPEKMRAEDALKAMASVET